MIYAIRAANARHGFRRAGTHFPGESWLLVDSPAPAVLQEAELTCVPVDAPDFDRRIGPLPILNPELLPEREPKETLADVTARLVRTQAELSEARTHWASALQREERAQGENDALRGTIEQLQRALVQATADRETEERAKIVAQARVEELQRKTADTPEAITAPTEDSTAVVEPTDEPAADASTETVAATATPGRRGR